MLITYSPSKVHEYEAALRAGMISSKKEIISSTLALKILEQISTVSLLEAAAEAAEAGELSYGYDLLEIGSEKFYSANREMALELVTKMIEVRHPNSKDESLAESIKNMFDDHVFPLVTIEHVKMIMDGYIPNESGDSEAISDAYHIVSYQVVSHCIMETLYSFNNYASE